MAAPFLGEIRIFGFDFAPRDWALCSGQILPISQNTALFSLLGTTYGGDGRATFQLPNINGNVLVNAGAGPGLSNYDLGDAVGVTQVALTAAQSAVHSHSLNVTASNATINAPAKAVLAQGVLPEQRGVRPYNTYAAAPPVPAAPLAPTAVLNAGGNLPHPNQQPYLVLNYCIALQGIFPTRP